MNNGVKQSSQYSLGILANGWAVVPWGQSRSSTFFCFLTAELALPGPHWALAPLGCIYPPHPKNPQTILSESPALGVRFSQTCTLSPSLRSFLMFSSFENPAGGRGCRQGRRWASCPRKSTESSLLVSCAVCGGCAGPTGLGYLLDDKVCEGEGRTWLRAWWCCGHTRKPGTRVSPKGVWGRGAVTRSSFPVHVLPCWSSIWHSLI